MIQITIPNYPKKIQVSKKRNAKYYHSFSQIKDKKILQKLKDGIYKWKYVNGKETLHDEKGELVIANLRSVGTPRFKSLNGQDNSIVGHFLSFIKAELKKQIENYFDLEKVVFNNPMKITYEFQDVIYEKGKLWDLDNRANIYKKVIQDIIRDKVMKKDDNILNLTSFEIIYTPIEKEENRMIIITIKEEERIFPMFYKKERKKNG